MAFKPSLSGRLTSLARPVLGGAVVHWLACLGLCAAYLQGGFNKLTDFGGAVAEMNHFGLSPAPVFAVLVIALELGASAMVLSGRLRWLASRSWPPSSRCVIGSCPWVLSALARPILFTNTWAWSVACC